MRHFLALAITLLSTQFAWATKARVNALENSRHLIDSQTVFENPSDLNLMGSWATFETGATQDPINPTTEPKAEGGFARAIGDTRWGFYMGHTTDATSLRQSGAPGIYLMEENPIDVFYAAKFNDLSWGLGLHYSNSDLKDEGKQSSTGVNTGIRFGPWEASLNLGLADSAEVPPANQTWKGKMSADLRGAYTLDEWFFYTRYFMSGGKHEVGGAANSDLQNSTIEIGATNSTKIDGGEFFWTAEYLIEKAENKAGAGSKIESSTLPFTIGIEADAASWLVLRGSVTQTVLLSSVKTNGESRTRENDTKAAAGVGLRFNKFVLDASLAASTTGLINGDNLLANAGLTYNF